jgi:hypothetical protein
MADTDEDVQWCDDLKGPLSERSTAIEVVCGWGLLIVIMIGVSIYSVGGIYKAVFSIKYSVSPDKVHVDAKPTDCDFNRAPLGDKGCHYEKFVEACNASGVVVAGTDAPIYIRDPQTRKPIISYDGGNTWSWMTTVDVPNPKVDSVKVTWRKVTD